MERRLRRGREVYLDRVQCLIMLRRLRLHWDPHALYHAAILLAQGFVDVRIVWVLAGAILVITAVLATVPGGGLMSESRSSAP